jgi:hypothetical protein
MIIIIMPYVSLPLQRMICVHLRSSVAEKLLRCDGPQSGQGGPAGAELRCTRRTTPSRNQGPRTGWVALGQSRNQRPPNGCSRSHQRSIRPSYPQGSARSVGVSMATAMIATPRKSRSVRTAHERKTRRNQARCFVHQESPCARAAGSGQVDGVRKRVS